ncbi:MULTISPECIES: nuclease-related domain-containing protein [unclassified Streptomyces]|uniref:nuclease-related domain-containing protein n=1 Tax=unclassified Streptomyces TaxID=2593676 RepID=UPI00093A03D3|nr:nuclease-related domain-containing protein [Streptomyces sp. CB02058]OKI98196.1 NERD nuclease [Streptomyces sp. CB02058]
MQDLKVTSWQLFGHDRLYVNLPDGTAIGWADRGSGTITVLHPRYRDAVTDALARQVPDLPALVGEDAPPVPQAPRTPPSAPRIPPLRGMRKRGALVDKVPTQKPPPAAEAMPAQAPVGEAPEAEVVPSGEAPEAEAAPVEEAAPVVAAVGETAPGHTAGETAPRHTAVLSAVPEPTAAPVPEPAAGHTPAPASAPAPASEPGTPSTGSRRPPVLPALTPGSDLATRRPGAALREQLGESATGALVRAATGALRRHKDGDPRRGALAGERRVGAELKRLTRHGWRVLHSVPLPDGTEIGHLLIGPGGVFAVSTEHHPGASVRIADGTLRTGDGPPQPYELDDRPGTRWARTVLETHCAFDVPVRTVLVFTGVTELEVVMTPADVRVLRERQLSALAPLTGVLTPTQVERVYDVARNREAWPGA